VATSAIVLLLAWLGPHPADGLAGRPEHRPSLVAATEPSPMWLGPERPVADPVDSSAEGRPSSVAFDGSNYLVVWTESRNVIPNNYGGDIRAARVTPTGAVLDPYGIVLASGPSDQHDPTVAFGDGTFLVAWVDDTIGTFEGDVRGVRVSPQGAVLDSTAIDIAAGPNNQDEPALAFGDGVFLAVWQDYSVEAEPGQVDVFGARLDADGRVLDDSGIVISAGPGNGFRPAVAFGGGVFLTVWGRVNAEFAVPNVSAARVSSAGVVLDPSGIEVAPSPRRQDMPTLASDGSVHLVVWQEYIEFEPHLVGTRVDATGQVLDPTGIAISGNFWGGETQHAVVAQGTQFLVAWYRRAGIVFELAGNRVDSTGAVLDGGGRVISSAVVTTPAPDPGLALGADGSNAFVVWGDERAGETSPYATQVGPDGVALGPGTLLARSASEQMASAVAYDGTNHLVVWNERAWGRNRLVAARVGRDGRLFDPSGIEIAAEAPAAVAVAFDGEHFLVAWRPVSPSDGLAGVSAVLVSRSGGIVRGPVDVSGPAPSGGLDVATNGSGFLVVWSDATLPDRRYVVRGARLDSNGTLLDPAALDIAPSGSSPSVASDGRDYLVTWSDYPTVRAGRVGSDGSVLDPSGFVVSDGGGDGPSVAWNGQRYLAVWSRDDGDRRHSVLGARITTAGAVQDPAAISIAEGDGSHTEPVVARNGPFLVAWREERSGRADGIYAARVDDTGAVLDPTSLVVAAGADGGKEPEITRGPGARWSISYTRFRPEAPYGANRVFVRTVGPK
jgi:hypothetical protein